MKLSDKQMCANTTNRLAMMGFYQIILNAFHISLLNDSMLKLLYIKVRWFTFFFYISTMCIASSCNNGKVKEKHPQARLGSTLSEFFDEGSINAYADSIKLHLSEFEKRESLLFTKEDYSFYVTRYSSNGNPVLYIEHGNGDIGSVEKYYYVDQQQLLLLVEDVFNSYESPRYSSRREYYRNDVLFHTDAKSADDEATFNAEKHEKAQSDKRDVGEILEYLESAINREGEFNLTFEGITEYPKARYIILSKNELKSYRAVVRVENEDEFIRELVTNTEKYKGTSLNISWVIKDGEAIYESGKMISQPRISQP